MMMFIHITKIGNMFKSYEPPQIGKDDTTQLNVQNMKELTTCPTKYYISPQILLR